MLYASFSLQCSQELYKTEVSTSTSSFASIEAIADNHGVDLLVAVGWTFSAAEGADGAKKCMWIRISSEALPRVKFLVAAVREALRDK